MNFLAHSLFANGDAERIAGQFCGDFVRGSDLSAYSVGIREGIVRHRRIDAYTDQHPDVKKMHHFFQPPLRRFAGIITDVAFDHYLARDWARYSDVALEAHVATVHAALNQQSELLPPDLQRFIRFIQQENVLLGNLHFGGVELTLQRLSRRSPRFAPIAEGAAVAQKFDSELASGFHGFFPDMLAQEWAR